MGIADVCAGADSAEERLLRIADTAERSDLDQPRTTDLAKAHPPDAAKRRTIGAFCRQDESVDAASR